MSEEKENKTMRFSPWLIFTVILVIVCFIACRWVFQYSHAHAANKEDFAKLAGIGFTFIAAAATIFTSIFNGFRTVSIERIKTTLAKELETFKISGALGLEFNKARLSAERAAIGELSAVAISNYYALQSAGTGVYSSEEISGAFKQLLLAQKFLYTLEDKYEVVWTEFIQQVVYTKETFEAIINANPVIANYTPLLKDSWQNQLGAPLSLKLEAVNKMISEKHRLYTQQDTTP